MQRHIFNYDHMSCRPIIILHGSQNIVYKIRKTVSKMLRTLWQNPNVYISMVNLILLVALYIILFESKSHRRKHIFPLKNKGFLQVQCVILIIVVTLAMGRRPPFENNINSNHSHCFDE